MRAPLSLDNVSTKYVDIRGNAYFAPDMRGMFVNEGLSGIPEKKLRNNKQSNILLAVKSFL